MSTINLVPEDYIEKRRRRRANFIHLVLFFMVTLGIIAVQAASEHSTCHAKETLDRINADYAEAARLIGQMRHLEAQERVLRKKAEVTAKLIERVPRSTLLAVVARALPEHSSLTKLELEMRRVVSAPTGEQKKRTKFGALSGKRAAPVRVNLLLDITGLAATDVEVARFIANLARNPLIATVDLEYSQEKSVDNFKVREFKVKAELKENADAVELRRQTKGGLSSIANVLDRLKTGRPR